MSRILVTGASGFVGRALAPVLARQHSLVLAARNPAAVAGLPGEPVMVGEIGPATGWAAALSGVEEVVHLAAHVHRPEGDDSHHDRVNHLGTRRLAEAARRAGVRRLVFLSTVKVHGEGRAAPYRESDAPEPRGPYASSKWAAERALAEVAAAGGPASIILRPPLIYGPGVGANFAALLRLARSGLPLPLAATGNRRSLLFVGNLAAAIARILGEPPRPECRTYLLRDGEDLSTGELVRRLAAAQGSRARLFAVPPTLLGAALRIAGGGGLADRLLGSLTVDDSRFRADFAWQPPFTVADGLAATAADSPR